MIRNNFKKSPKHLNILTVHDFHSRQSRRPSRSALLPPDRRSEYPKHNLHPSFFPSTGKKKINISINFFFPISIEQTLIFLVSPKSAKIPKHLYSNSRDFNGVLIPRGEFGSDSVFPRIDLPWWRCISGFSA